MFPDIMTPPLRWTQARGRVARRAILAELRRRHDAGASPVTMQALATATGIRHGAVWRHVRVLKDAALVVSIRGPGGGIRLTDAGLRATD
ncbi:MAG TPA: hypothetical protein DCQ64_23900 [Candidatus Rokubacteria bacterium]|nr:hypothetical protein [Candidatus Rokubacteria bacterium]